MRVIVFLALTSLLVFVKADDKSSCEKKCDAKYLDVNETACKVGCSQRGSPSSGGPLSFVTCHRGCDEKYMNATSEKDACHFACSIPMRSSVVMTLVNDNGTPKWKVVEQEGDDELVTSLQSSDSFDQRLHNFLRRPLKLTESHSESEEADDDSDEINEIHQKMLNMFSELHRKFIENLRSLKQQENVAIQRPSGHDPWGQNMGIVGNTNEDGNPIIVARPLNDENPNGITLELHHYKPRSHLLMAFHWVLILTGGIALIATLYAIAVFLRSIRNNEYHRMGRTGGATMPIFARVQPVSPLPVKKLPEEGWIERTEPSGVAPPAYDQVSIHTSPTIADSDKSTSEAETPSPLR